MDPVHLVIPSTLSSVHKEEGKERSQRSPVRLVAVRLVGSAILAGTEHNQASRVYSSRLLAGREYYAGGNSKVHIKCKFL